MEAMKSLKDIIEHELWQKISTFGIPTNVASEYRTHGVNTGNDSAWRDSAGHIS